MSEFNMAGAKAKTKVSIETSSRFSVLGIESEEEEEKKSTGKISNAEKNAKKRARKKKKAAEQSQNASELRDMAFFKPVSAAAIQSIHQRNHPMPIENSRPTLINPLQHNRASINSSGTQSRNMATESIDRDFNENSWEEWKSKDETYVMNQFERDLQAALRLSAEDGNKPKKSNENKHSGKKKNQKKATMSLEEFTTMTTESTSIANPPSVKQPVLNGYCPEELDPNHFEYEQPVPDAAPARNLSENKKSKRKSKKKPSEDKATLSAAFSELPSNKIMNSNKLVQQDSSMVDPASMAAFRDEIDKKNQEILRLQRSNGKLVEELAGVKKRNEQLCFILAQGEMKEKFDILLQVEDLNNVKNELSSELEGTYSALEQERTKVTMLKQELQKYQGSRMHSKSLSEDA